MNAAPKAGEASPALDPTVTLGDPLLDDFRNFQHECLKCVLGVSPTRLQYDMGGWLSGGPNLRILEAFRGASKSWQAAFLAAWWVLRDWVLRDGRPEINLLVASGTKDRADGFSTFSRDLFSVVPVLRPLVPKDPRRWSTISFDVEGAAPSQTPTVSSRAVFGRITGDRADGIIGDDLEIPQNAETEGQRDKLRRRVSEFQDVLKPRGHILILGTPHTEDSVYNRLPDWGFSRRIWPARYPQISKIQDYGEDLAPFILDPLTADESLAGRPTEPTRFDEQELVHREQRGRTVFALQYMLDTTLADEDRYPLKLRDLVITDCAPDALPERPIWAGSPEYRREDLPNVGLPGDRFQRPASILQDRYGRPDGCVVAVDPSGRGADETSWCAVAAQGSMLYLLESHGDQRGYEGGVLDAIADTCVATQATAVVVESNYGDGMFTTLLKSHLHKHKVLVSVEEFRATGMKEARILDVLEPVMAQHRLVVAPPVVEGDKPRLEAGDAAHRYKLFHQMTRLTRQRGCLEHDDRVEALSMAVRYWVERMAVDQETYVMDREQDEMDAALEEFWDTATGMGQGGQFRATPTAASNRGLRCFDVK